tara:strand:- start:81 stop:371 length:291 start_codon:yes stop_codon:yes gene_type:complete
MTKKMVAFTVQMHGYCYVDDDKLENTVMTADAEPGQLSSYFIETDSSLAKTLLRDIKVFNSEPRHLGLDDTPPCNMQWYEMDDRIAILKVESIVSN